MWLSGFGSGVSLGLLREGVPIDGKAETADYEGQHTWEQA